MRTYSPRPKKPRRFCRTKVAATFLTDAEHAVIVAAVRRRGSTMADFVRAAILKAADAPSEQPSPGLG